MRVADQRVDRFPDRCVLSGETTSHAVRVVAVEWAGPRFVLEIPGATAVIGALPGNQHIHVALPVSLRVWRSWRRRSVVAVAIAVFGLCVFASGLVQSELALAAIGACAVAAAMAYRTRATRDRWVTCRFRPDAASSLLIPASTSRRVRSSRRDWLAEAARNCRAVGVRPLRSPRPEVERRDHRDVARVWIRWSGSSSCRGFP